jgi:SAM-dependent methyltransferase
MEAPGGGSARPEILARDDAGRPGSAVLSLVCPACGSTLSVEPDGRSCPRCARPYPDRDGVLDLRTTTVGAPGFDPHFYAGLRELEERHFWFVSRREVILAALRRKVPDLASRPLFDIGCGSGGLLAHLRAAGVPLAGACDAFPEALELARRRLDVPLLLIDDGRLPPLGRGQPMVGLFDVLEHIDDDAGTLAWLHSVLEPGGVLALTVPAHPFLYDYKDALSRHRRRYAGGELRRKLEAVGFEVLLLEHFMATLVPIRWIGRFAAFGTRRGEGERPDQLTLVPWVNGLMLAALRVEQIFSRWARLPFGTSLIAIARRP